MEWLRILRLLLYKSLLIRRRQWKTTLIGEFLVPVGVIAAVWAVRNMVAKESVSIDHDTVYPRQPVQQYFSKTFYNTSVDVFYAPNYTFPNVFMQQVEGCLMNGTSNVTFRLHGHETEEALVRDYENKSQYYSYGKHGAVIFDDRDINSSATRLGYRIRMKNLNLKNAFNILGNMSDFYTVTNMFLQLQICMDQSFIKMHKPDLLPNMYIQRMPYPTHIEYDLADVMFRQFFSAMAVAVFVIPLLIEAVNASNEKFIGVNILMKMNGVSNALNLLSWLISGSITVILLCIIPITILINFTSGGALPYLNYGNSFIVGLVLSLSTVHLFAYGIHISAYFPTPLLVMFGILLCNTGVMVLQNYGLKEEQYWMTPFLGILFPNLLMFRAVEELNYYENIREGNQWSNMFKVGNSLYGFGGSMGMIVVLSIIGTALQFLLAVYVYEVNPGKYGARRHPLFFLKPKENKMNSTIDIANLEFKNDGKPFESPPKGLYSPGLQIRNLKKSYNISLFNDIQVHALRGISVDFYKGTITSLLGHNGAGKTTLMSILTGMISPTEGLVLVNGKNIKDNAQEIMREMGLCTQANMVFPNLTVSEQLKFFAMLKGKDKSVDDVEEKVTELLKKLRLYEKRNALPEDLSGGQKRRVCLGMALIGDPSILILDEPSSGLDPESRRIIWDILLRMRGQKTIIISTHDMEEADILGDRIAIMHSGQLRSFGTTMFLKKLIGQGNVEVTLSIEPWTDKSKILNELNNRGNIISADGSKIVIKLPDSPNLPDTLDKLDYKKRELGISGLSVSLMSLEQVFLKVTQENEDLAKKREPFSRVDRRLTGRSLFLQCVRALFYKKISYTAKNISSIFIMLLSILVMLFCLSLIFQKADFVYPKPEVTSMRLDQYPNSETLYNGTNRAFANIYAENTRRSGGKATETNSSLVDALLDYARQKDHAYYDNHMIAAAEFDLDSKQPFVNAIYSEKTTYSIPISVNLLSNSLIQHYVGPNYSISLTAQEIPTISVTDNSTANGYSTGVVFMFLLLSTFAQFVVHPLRETAQNVKQLQRMTGLSCFTYWGTMFAFDFVVFLVLIVLIVLGFIGIDALYDLKLFDTYGILIMILLLVLFAINVLPLIYTFSFMNGATVSVLRLLTYVPMGLILIEVIGLIFSEALNDNAVVIFLRPIQKLSFLLIPYISLLHGQMAFFAITIANARCRNMPNVFYETKCFESFRLNLTIDNCCYRNCSNGECDSEFNYFNNFKGDINLERGIIYLACTPILYFGLLVILEFQLIQKLMARWKQIEVPEVASDEQVRKEKLSVKQKISALEDLDAYGNYNHFAHHKLENGNSIIPSNGNTPVPRHLDDRVFLVYELRKKYGDLLAVQDVTFGVKRHECFGLLGVNGAGKSTTFRMMTGQEVPDNGLMYINNKEFTRHTKYFLSKMGYCPQNDAIIKSLNSYDHLRLFARLRGIPEHHVEVEVKKWINRLNLNACASQPSGTYSGGNKRRLNIAMALIGLPNLILLDEPTAGVDPGARRSLWNVIQSCQMSGQAVVLTSHSMEECEALCNKLAIMVGGRLVCIGPSQELKQRFGAGYDIQIKMDPEKEANQIAGIKTDLARALDCEIVDENTGYLMYHVSPSGTSWRKMYNVMNELKGRYNCIDDFSVLSSTLEQLFLQFARAANAPKDVKIE